MHKLRGDFRVTAGETGLVPHFWMIHLIRPRGVVGLKVDRMPKNAFYRQR